jgi:ATP-dependent 26S proteasome regulatory subunit
MRKKRMPESKDAKNLSPWVKEVILQRQTMYGPMVLVETDDERRFRAILQQRPRFSEVNGGEEWYTLENWKGLRQVLYNDTDGKKKIDYNIIQDTKMGGGVIYNGMAKAEEFMQDEKHPMVLVVKGLLQTDPYTNNVLFSWATNMDVMNKKSTIILFLEDRNIIPQSIWSHMKIVVPPKSTEDEREADLKSAITCGAMEVDKKTMPSAVRLLAGLNLDQTDALITELSIRNLGKMDLDILAKLKTQILARDPVIDVINPPKFGFEAVGGYDALKKRIINDIVMPIKHPDYAKEYSISESRGLLLFGPPGTGKTLLAKAIQKELNMTMITMQPDKVFSKWVGESEKALRRVFKILEAMQPCILFIDELDRYGKRSTSPTSNDDSGGAQVNRQIFSMLLEELGNEDRRWFFIANTNLVDTIDPAMRRTGRIDSVVPVPYPDEAARVEILKIHAIKKRNLKLDAIDWSQLASKTQYWAGSDLESLVVRTANMKMEEAIKLGQKQKITMQDFNKAYDTFNIDTGENKRKQKEVEEQALRFTNDKRLEDIFKKDGMDGKSFDTRMENLKKMSWDERAKEGAKDVQ